MYNPLKIKPYKESENGCKMITDFIFTQYYSH